MKSLCQILFLLLPFHSIGQKKIIGNYNDYFGHYLQIKPDSTFEFQWKFHIQKSWSQGVWKSINDTIYFTVIPRYDTVKTANSDGIMVDSLFLSRFNKPMSAMEIALSNDTWQNRVLPPPKLLYRNHKLYLIENGQIRKEKIKGLSSKKKYPVWFTRSKD